MSTRRRGQPVVLLHGWPVTQAHWRHLLPPLRRAGFAPVPLTLPGLGSSPDEAYSFRKADLADWVHDQLTRQGVTQFAVIGHDWGGTVAVLLAASIPAAVTALVIEEEIPPGIDVDVPAPGNEHYPSWHGPFNRAPGLAEQLVPGRENAYYGLFLRQSAGPAGLDPDVVRCYAAAYTAPGVLEAGLAYYRTRSADVKDVHRLLANPIAAPVLAVGGGYAMGTAVTDAARLLADEVTGIVLDPAGHYPVEQDPEPAAQVITEFLHRHHDARDDRQHRDGTDRARQQ
ncbi:MAG: alpha/beta hydrolase [Nocardioidaceae bacterium]|nr:alpha/beta hydrolase [Nocardioidaceae bacterium]